MSEFKLYHLVKEVLSALGNNNRPEEYIQCLQSNMGAQVASSSSHLAVQNLIEQLAQNSNSSEALLGKFEELKQKDVDSLASFVHLIHLVAQDTGVKEILSKTLKNVSSSSSIPATVITKDDLPQVKHRLKKAITESKNTDIDSSHELSKSGISTDSSPSVTSWVQRRPSLSWDFSSHNILATTGPIGNIPPTSQENILIEDLLNILMGLPGYYIQPLELKDVYDPREFTIDKSVDPSLRELVKQILPLASNYSVIQRFIEEKTRFEFGAVNNALAECFQKTIIDYTLFITKLETESQSGNLNLHKMWFFIQTNLHSLNIIASIATTINRSDSMGGKVLSLLHENIVGFMGESKAQDLCVMLMEAACVPYMKMLGMWIYKGIISDPKKEFLVEDMEGIQKEDMPIDYSADYWDKKYSIRRERIPKFLEPVSDIILRAGKYLNVIRQCGKSLNNKIETIEYKIEEKHYIESIEKAYTYASQTLLNLVLKEQDLLGRLKSVKHYFLLDQGDFIVTFLTLCEKELSKDVNDVLQARLESLLDLALSSISNDPYRDDLRAEMLPYDLQFQMFKILSIQTNAEQEFRSPINKKSLSVIDSFSFSYEVRWPLSLILNRKSLACYQMIFRYLFYCKYVERMVCQVWKSNKVAKKFPISVAKQYRTAFALRQRMLHCVQNLEYHMMVEVVEPHWITFLQKIAKVTNVDEVLACHYDFLDTCLKDCMLTIPSLLSIITKLLMICVNFCKFMQNETIFNTAESNQITPEHMESFEESITRFDIEFTAAVMQLIDEINDLNKVTSENDRLFNLLYRLDFNSFYTGKLEKVRLSKLNTKTSG